MPRQVYLISKTANSLLVQAHYALVDGWDTGRFF